MISSTIKQKQHGTALTWVVSLFFIFMMAALVVDGARLYHEKRQLQTMANSLATRMVDEGQACFGSELAVFDPGTAQSDLDSFFPDSEVTVAAAQRVLVESTMGEYVVSSVNGDARRSNGVAITLSRPVGGLLAFVVEDDMVAHAVARKEVVASLSMESFAADLDTTQSALLNAVFSEILGAPVSLSALQFNELGNTLIDIEELLSELAGDTPLQEFLGDEEAANVVVNALGVVGGLDGASSGLQQISSTLVGTNVDLTDIFSGIEQSSIPPGSKVPLLGVVNALVMNVGAALPTSIDIDLLDETTIVGPLLSGLGVEVLTLTLEIDQAPASLTSAARRIEDEDTGDWGWPRLRSRDIGAQVHIEVDAGIPVLLTLEGDIDLELNVASGEAELTAARCAQGGNENEVDIHVRGRPSLLALTGNLDLDVNLLGVGLSVLEAEVGESDPGEGSWNQRSFFDVELFDPQPQPAVSLGGSDDAVNNALDDLLDDTQIELLGIDLGGVLSPLTGLLRGILQPIVTGVLEPLLDALGLSLGESRLQLLSVTQSIHLIEGIEPPD
ncbi:pilus assembly protein TadG-related protein [Alcanivorax sp.]|uniref:pilus assembly protein TadG-related protein n=1 Tax=Alcanivorax sp. TaxID=1872427 RepID=UPI000C0EB795|nr:pilus assembly protein TadG-related protein [Alcanivorax sp.]PHR68111.1 MAG: hypothetical protein COA55_02510 [Alcanivorax sp.]